MRKTTKQAISESLKTLLEKQTIDKITIKEIVAECGVNRQTFYYHFSDIYELLEWALEDTIQEYITVNPVPKDDWQEQIYLFYRFLYSHRRIILHAYDPINRTYYENFTVKFIEPIIMYRISLCPAAVHVPEDKRQFVQQVYTWICSDLIIEWVEHGMPDEQKTRLDDYITLVNGSLDAALERFIPNHI
ncbi:MAG: TetR/AcrR family transcriptional regulator C-terminal domain-containing protein [Eubacteriales bacterium]|nr:TetR/AcrR family transcriptional regulator C-terminal domain-containing protein [Eubacteriales bacterium]